MKPALLIDAGNTRVKLAWLSPDGRAAHGATQTLSHPALAEGMARWLSATAPPSAFSVWISNVAGDAVAGQMKTVLDGWPTEVHLLQSQPLLDGLHNDYETPQRLGVDRWLGLLGVVHHARQQHPDPLPPLLLAHFGTATTVDTVIDHHFVGGLILPGYQLMLSSLARGTAGLPLATGQAQDFPRSTHDAIVSGIVAAQAGAVLRQRHHVLHRTGRPPLIYVAGGAWTALAGALQSQLTQVDSTSPLHVVDNPVLDGLARVAALRSSLSS